MSDELKHIAMDLRNRGFSGIKIAKILGVSDSWVCKWIPKGVYRHRWSKQETNAVIKAYEDGIDTKKIACKIGCTENAIRIVLCRHKRHEQKDVGSEIIKMLEKLYYINLAINMGCSKKEAVKAVEKADVVGRYELFRRERDYEDTL